MLNNKKGLGRGLDALFGVYKDDSYENITKKAPEPQVKVAVSGGVSEIAIDKVKPNPNQPRKNFDEEALNELAASIKLHGIVQPIVVNDMGDGSYMIIAGERRWRAANICGLKTVPAVVRKYTDKQVKEISIIENLQREDLTSIEEAKAYKAIIESLRITQDELAKKIGKSRSHITNMLGLLRLPLNV